MTPSPAFLAQVAAELLARIDDAPSVPAQARRLRRRLAFAGGYAVHTFCWRHRLRLGGLDIDEAVDAILARLLRPNGCEFSRRDQIAAYHEAGHVFMAWAGRIAIDHVSIVKSKDSNGYVLWRRIRKNVCDRTVRMLIGGALAQGYFCDHIDGWEDDGEQITNLICPDGVWDDKAQTVFDRLMVETANTLWRRWGQVQAIAEALLERRTVTGNYIYGVCRRAGPRRPPSAGAGAHGPHALPVHPNPPRADEAH